MSHRPNVRNAAASCAASTAASAAPCGAALGAIIALGLMLCLAAAPLLASTRAQAAQAAQAKESTSLDYTPELDQGLLGEGRAAYRERADHDRARDAYRIFKEYFDAHPGDPTAAWHLGMACYFMGMRVVDKADKKEMFAEGRDRAAEGLETDPDCGPCHLMTAVNHALWAREVGLFRTLVGLPSVKSHLHRAAELDPEFAGGAPYRVLAAIDKVVPRLLGGGRKKARRSIEKAIEVAPDEPLNYEILADILIDDYHDPAAAVKVARRGLRVPPPGPEYVESRDAIEALEHIVERHGKRSGS
jgi:hypothetical protein